MKDNSHQKDSLRANGAYTAPSIQWGEKKFIIENVNNIEQICNEAINDFKDESRKFIEKVLLECGDFDSFVLKQSGIMDEMLLKMLASINLEQYSEAESIAQSELNQGRGGRFQNKGRDINEYILMFCVKKKSK